MEGERPKHSGDCISADKTEQRFKKKRAYHQWPDNYCDFTGMSGESFTNYGVLGVPTLFMLDRQGVVVRNTAMVDELMEIVEGYQENS